MRRGVLQLTRRPGEAVWIGDEIRVEVIAVHGKQVRLGLSCPNRKILREELKGIPPEDVEEG